MKQYEASIEIDGQLETIRFETDIGPVAYLWQRYGMSSYIEWLREPEQDEGDGDD